MKELNFNAYKLIAGSYGVALNEEFTVMEEKDGETYTLANPFFFDETGLKERVDASTFSDAPDIERAILSGNITVVSSWSPERGDVFHFVKDATGKIDWHNFDPKSAIDLALLQSGNCFRTLDLAIRLSSSIITKLFGTEENSDLTNEE